MEIPAGQDVWQKTVSLIGSKNSTLPGDTYSLSEVNNDNQLGRDVGLYQFFRIRGVAIKMIFPMPTSVESSPVQWAIGYSQNEVLYPAIIPERLQTLATYQTGSCNQNKPISRFYNTAKTYRRFGIQYQTTDAEIGNFLVPGTLYGGSLPVDQGSSVALKVYR